MRVSYKKDFLINIAFYTVVLTLIFFLLRFLAVYLFPFIIGTAVTILVQRPADFFSKRLRLKKGYCALILVIFSYLLIVSVLFFVAVKILEYSATAIANYSYLIDDFMDNLSVSLIGLRERLPEAVIDLAENSINSITTSLADYISAVAKSAAKITPIFITSSVVTIVASCYIARDYDRFKASINSVLKDNYKEAAKRLRNIFKNNVLKLIKGYTLILIITIAELTVGLMALGIKGFVISAVIIGFLDLLPVLGTGTVLIPWGIYALLSSDLFLGIGLLLLYAIIMVVRNIIEPKIIGKQIGLHPLITLVAVFVGLRLFGLIGVVTFPFGIMLVWKMYEEGIFEILFNQ